MGAMVRRAYQEHPDLDFAVIGGDLVQFAGRTSPVGGVFRGM